MMMSLKKEMVALAQQQNNYVYIVRCRDQTLYTGWTNQLEKRIEAHNAGKGAKYTKARRPVELVYFETFEHKSEALKREYQIKQLKRSEKEKHRSTLKFQCFERCFSFGAPCRIRTYDLHNVRLFFNG